MLEKINKIDASLLIFFITGLGYTITYFFEWGYLNYYRLPSSLIDININNIIRNIFIISIFFGAGYIQDYYSEKIGKISIVQKWKEKILKRKPKSKSLLAFFIVVVIVLVILIITKPHVVWFVLGVALAAAYLCIHFNHIGPVVLALILLVLSFSFLFGQALATFTYNYLVLESSSKDKSAPSMIIIDYYKDKAIVAEADLKEKIISPKYEFIKLEADPGKIKFEMKQTGRMKVADPSSD